MDVQKSEIEKLMDNPFNVFVVLLVVYVVYKIAKNRSFKKIGLAR